MAFDDLGNRMKQYYELPTRYFLPRRTYTICRIDGRSFHTYTHGLDRPYDQQLMDDMATTAKELCQQISGVAFAYCQSDEISLLLTDFATLHTEPWFGGNLQKMVSISASIATVEFNALRPGKKAHFDSRVFTIPTLVEVGNYFVWRQADAVRNSITMAAQAQFSHKALQKKSCNDMQEMLFTQKGINWNDYPDRCKRGTVVFPQIVFGDAIWISPRTGVEQMAKDVQHRVWITEGAPVFTQKSWLANHIPQP